MATITVINNQAVDSTGWTSAQFTMPNISQGIKIDLACPTWDAVAGQGNFTWQLQYQDAQGAWQILVGQTIPLGARSRSGAMPELAISATSFTGKRCRGFLQSDVAVNVTLTATVA